MKKALISPNEVVLIDGQPTGMRIAQVVPAGSEFEVAGPLFWIDVADDVEVDASYYDSIDETVKLKP